MSATEGPSYGSGYDSPYRVDLEAAPETLDDWGTCRERVRDARNVLHDVNLGRQVETVTHDGRTVTYTRADADRLQAYINTLCRACPDGFRDAADFNRRRSRGRAHVVTWCR